MAKFVKTITHVEVRSFNVIIEASCEGVADAIFNRIQRQDDGDEPWTSMMDRLRGYDADDEMMTVTDAHAATEDDVRCGYHLNGDAE